MYDQTICKLSKPNHEWYTMCNCLDMVTKPGSNLNHILIFRETLGILWCNQQFGFIGGQKNVLMNENVHLFRVSSLAKKPGLFY